ncbi:MAG: ribonuclease P protein component [Cyanobacteria bacterium P01_H01_bin.74]
MLPQENRLKARRFFKRVLSTKPIFSCKQFLVLAMPVQAVNKTSYNFEQEKKVSKTKQLVVRIGFIVSKKVHRKAVKRNYIKRLLRSIVRNNLVNQNNFLSRFSGVVIIAKEPILESTAKELNHLVNRCNQIASRPQ